LSIGPDELAVSRPEPASAAVGPPSMLRVGASIVIGTVAWALPTLGTSATLLPALVALIARGDKVISLGILTAAGALTSLVCSVIFGALSDITRSRFGARTPWIVGGGLAASVFMTLLSTAHTLPRMFLWWCLYQVCSNAISPNVLAIIPDRVPADKRGRVSSAYGVGVLTAAAIGMVVGSRFLAAPGKGMLVMAVIVAVLPIICVLSAPDRSNLGVKRAAINVRSVLASCAFPKKAADFYWAFFGRLAIVLGINMVSTYQLYIITDYIRLDQAAAATLITIGSVTNFVASLLASGFSGPISDRIKRRKLPIIAASFIFAFAVLIPFAFPTAHAMLAYFGLAGIGFGVYFAVDAALMSEVLPNKLSHGKDLGILSMANSGGSVLAPAVSSALVGLGFGFAPVFIAACALAVVGGLAIVPIKSVR
jgi:MFS family permease